jgi:TolB-like protein
MTKIKVPSWNGLSDYHDRYNKQNFPLSICPQIEGNGMKEAITYFAISMTEHLVIQMLTSRTITVVKFQSYAFRYKASVPRQHFLGL